MRCGIHLLVVPVVALTSGPVAAAPDSSAGCWTEVERHRDLATTRWTANDPVGALSARLDLLEQAASCGDGTAEQVTLLQVSFENVFLQEEGAGLIASRAAEVHLWYRAFKEAHPVVAGELADAYLGFVGRFPAAAPKPVVADSTGGDVQIGTELPPPDQRPAPPSSPQPRRGLKLGGASILTVGLGAFTAGFVSLGLMVKAQKALEQHCTPTCGDRETSTDLVAAGELHEILAPVFLASGAALVSAGGVMLGLGLRNQRPPLVVPVLSPRFAGALWVVRF